MTLEADIVTVLKTCCPRVKPDFAPFNTERPYVIYQAVGGQAWRHVDNTPAGLRHTLLQVTVWAATRAAASDLIRQIEEAFCAATVLTARPAAEAVSIAEEDLNLYGSQQDFDLFSPR